MNPNLSNQELIELFASPDWRVRQPAHDLLPAQGPAVIDDLVHGLKHPNANVRWWCAQMLDHAADDTCVPALFDLLHDPVPCVRRMAVHALACQRCKTAPLQADMTDMLIDFALHDPNLKVRGEAVFGLAFVPANPRVTDALQQIIAEFEVAQPKSQTQRNLVNGARWSLKRHQQTTKF
jgi:hypothetical protein